MKYIDIKKLVNNIITKITTEIKNTYDENELSHFAKQYQCENIRDIVTLLLCQDCNTSFDADSLEFIKELESDLSESNLQIELLENSVITANESNNGLSKQINILNQSVQGGSDESNIIEQYNQILKANGLDFETESKKLNLQPSPQFVDGISI